MYLLFFVCIFYLTLRRILIKYGMKNFKALADFYLEQLLSDTLPFWEEHSLDKKYGGYYTCLDRKGNVYDTDKFMWLQGRQIWTFSMLYNRLERREEWLNAAKHGVDFITKHGRDKKGNWYFSLNREGKPLIQPYSIFSDCFACMGLAQYSLASGDKKAEAMALETFYNILKKQKNPSGQYTKAYPGTRPLRSFATPMILSNLVMELGSLLDKKMVEKTIDEAVDNVMNIFYDKKTGLVFEHVLANGKHSDSFKGRLINPGHTIEAMWFMMDIFEKRNDQKNIEKACDIAMRTLKFGWDKEFGGIYYFKDVKGNPTEQLEWDQKLWWVHLETLITLIKGYRLTGRKDMLIWFEKIHNYSWKRFHDEKDGEWFGYLNRRGDVLLPLKGGKWKGCFHLPRAQLVISKELEKLS